MKGHIREVFTSIQGEGIKVGKRQTFIRFLGCNLSCNYCDTPESQKKFGPFFYKGKSYPNPIEVDFLLDKLPEPEIAVTGGEPLLQLDFLIRLCTKLKKDNKAIYIDTNGTLPRELGEVINLVDTVSLDFKIPTATGRPKLWKEHEECLKIAAHKNVFVKMVINDNLLPQELSRACDIISRVDVNIPLIIQPEYDRPISNLLQVQATALEHLNDVRVIPQVHKYLGLA